jgi:hypothetical protein
MGRLVSYLGYIIFIKLIIIPFIIKYRGWAFDREFASTVAVTGTSVRFLPSHFQGITIHQPVNRTVNISDYNAILFDMSGASPGNQIVEVSLVSNGVSPGRSQLLSNYLSATRITTDFQSALVPINAFHFENEVPLTGITFQGVREKSLLCLLKSLMFYTLGKRHCTIVSLPG